MGKTKQTYFKELWLSDPEYSHWVQRAKLKTDYINFAKKKINLVQSVLLQLKT